MAFDRAAPPALRWVALFLAVCAGLGLWLGFKDQMRRNPPAWYTGADEAVAAPGSSGSTARDAVAFDPNAPTRPLAAGPAGAADDKPQAKPDEKSADPAVTDGVATTTDQPKALDIPAPPKPKATPTPAPKSAPGPSEDPVGDLLEGQKPAEGPPVPY